jgi:hypothetical protein
VLDAQRWRQAETSPLYNLTVQAKDFMQKVVALVVAAATKGAGGDVSRVCTV